MEDIANGQFENFPSELDVDATKQNNGENVVEPQSEMKLLQLRSGQGFFDPLAELTDQQK